MNVILVTTPVATPPVDAVWIRDRLVAQGHTVTYIDQTAAAPSFVGVDLVIFGNGISLGSVGTKYDSAPCGVLSMRQKPHSLFSTSGSASAHSSIATLNVLITGDALTGAIGLGTQTVTGVAATPFYYTDTTLSAATVKVISAQSGGSVTRITAARLEAGQLLSDATTPSPSRRTLLAIQAGYANLTATGIALFDNAVAWTSQGDHPPVANAGADQDVNPGVTVTLNSTASSDPDAGDVISRVWSQTSGPAVTLSSSTAAQPTFTAPSTVNDSTLVFHLVVTDSFGMSSTDDVTVTVAPVAYRLVREGGAWVRHQRRARASGAWA